MGRKRILVVDDEPKICELVSAMLELDHHTVEIAYGGREALDKFSTNSFDVVFTDFLMPGMNGDQLAIELHKLAPEVPIILLSACPPSRPPKQIRWILMKPFTPIDLRLAISKVCDLAPAA